MLSSPRNLALATIAIGVILLGIFAGTVLPVSIELRKNIRQAMIERHAALLQPIALQQIAEFEAGAAAVRADEVMSVALNSARQEGMLAVVIFDVDGELIRAVPQTLLLPELAAADYLQLLGRAPISRYHAHFPLERYFRRVATDEPTAPILEVLLPLHGRDSAHILGFAQYLMDGRALGRELKRADDRIWVQTALTLAIGSLSIALLGTGAYLGLRRAHRLLAERSERLARANFELTLAAKTSALGQITSHLIHGLKGPVAGLRAVVAARGENRPSEWQTAADYTGQLEALIRETVDLLTDMQGQAIYELTGHELIDALRRRCTASRAQKVAITFSSEAGITIDNHRGGLLCLIASNLVQNAIDAANGDGAVAVKFTRDRDRITLTVSDDGMGIPDQVRPRLFEPGCTGRPGGTGLGLAISQLLARQMNATLALESTGPGGTTFTLCLSIHQPGTSR